MRIVYSPHKRQTQTFKIRKGKPINARQLSLYFF